METAKIIKELKDALRLEETEQEKRFLSDNLSLKELRKDGLVIHPVKIQNKSFGFTDQPIITVSFHVPQGINSSYYSSGTPIAIFNGNSQEVCNGHLLSISEKGAEILLFSDDFPDWIDEKSIGIKRLPDDKSFKLMHGILKTIKQGDKKILTKYFNIIHQLAPFKSIFSTESVIIDEKLNPSQNKAVQNGLINQEIQIIHGPPGTGKTTTLVALIQALRKQNQSIVASAPSNAAIDHLASQLLEKGMKVLRLGNTSKVNHNVWNHTPEGILSQEKFSKKIRKLKIQAEEYRKMARQYKRNFGKEEREQRKLLFKEVYAIRDEIKELTNYYLENYLKDVDVILGTPVGLMDKILQNKQFDVAILDEAGQCLEPLAWLVFEKAERIILAGDHLQLPPTILSDEAAKTRLSKSILETAIDSEITSAFLEHQYRMTPEIAGFSSIYFYKGKLQSVPESIVDSFIFYDTAGANFLEEREEARTSISNPEELKIIEENYQEWIKGYASVVFISPYAGQVELAKERLKGIHISTIDSFQGQEADLVIISLVRSNPNGAIGFLSDYRRMNVALTRAKKKLIIIGDSTTLTSDAFYQKFVEYTEKIGGYRSVFELIY
ncbi:MAG: AAA domain-containing protein [Brumimicrobium sp.]